MHKSYNLHFQMKQNLKIDKKKYLFGASVLYSSHFGCGILFKKHFYLRYLKLKYPFKVDELMLPANFRHRIFSQLFADVNTRRGSF